MPLNSLYSNKKIATWKKDFPVVGVKGEFCRISFFEKTDKGCLHQGIFPTFKPALVLLQNLGVSSGPIGQIPVLGG